VILAQSTSDPFLQYGALGLVALVVVYLVRQLVVWLTGTLNGKLDRLAAATDTNTAATREAVGASQEAARQIERLRGEIQGLRGDLDARRRQ
jgi:hypothetical protein